MPVTLSNIPEISNISIEEALRALLDYANAKGLSDYVIRLNLLLGEYIRTTDALTLTSEQKSAKIASVHKAVLNIVVELETNGSNASDDSILVSQSQDSLDPEIHKNTCNRDEQLNSFKKINDSLDSDRGLQFYYVLGSESDVVPGFIKRVAFDLSGNVLGRLDSSNDSIVKVETDELDFRLVSSDERSSLIELKKAVFDRFGVDTTNPSIAPLEGKTFQYLLDHSPLLKEKGRRRIFITHILVHELEWDEDLVPQIFDTFFQQFFESFSAESSFEFLFFVGFEYDEEDGEDIRQIIRDQSLEIDGLEKIPALQKISYKDVRRWFNSYRFMFEDSGDRKDKLIELFGEDKDVLFDMEGVQRKLKQLIKEYNNAQLYG